MKPLFKTSTKTISEAEAYLLASELVLSELIRKQGFTFKDDDATKEIQRVYTLIVDSAKV